MSNEPDDMTEAQQAYWEGRSEERKYCIKAVLEESEIKKEENEDYINRSVGMPDVQQAKRNILARILSQRGG